MNKDNTKTEFIIVRVTKKEKEEFRSTAEKVGLTISEKARQKLGLSV